MRAFVQTNKLLFIVTMKCRFLAGLAFLAAFVFTACDETTDHIGISLVNNMDNLDISTDTFTLSTRSIVVDSVLSLNTVGYLGKIRDPETGNYITGDFMTQFHTMENFKFPTREQMLSVADGEVVADSCDISLYFVKSYGDTLTSMKLRASEMIEPMKEGVLYYSTYDPKANGLLREDGLIKEHTYSLVNYDVPEATRKKNTYTPYLRIKLNDEYTDKDGYVYNNYGTYIIHSYYMHPEYFKNSLTFINNVVPGFYFENVGGLGSMAYITVSQLNVYFRYLSKDTLSTGVASFSGTEEVLQQTRITNDKASIKKLASDNTCTYLKTPAGIFTEITIPVDDIYLGHEKDSINTAKVVLTRINDSHYNKYALPVPSEIMMIPADSLNTFFEKGRVTNNRTSYLATFSKTYNSYTFSNISGMLSYMNKHRGSENWNKVVLVPVTKTTNSSTGEVTKIVHDMSLTSTRLIGGSENPHEPVKISVIYSKFK